MNAQSLIDYLEGYLTGIKSIQIKTVEEYQQVINTMLERIQELKKDAPMKAIPYAQLGNPNWINTRQAGIVE